MNFLQRSWKSRSGDGAVEYIVIVGVVLFILMYAFWGTMAVALEDRLNELGVKVTVPGKKKPKPVPPKPDEPEIVGGAGGGGFGGGSGSGPTPIFSTEPVRGR